MYYSKPILFHSTEYRNAMSKQAKYSFAEREIMFLKRIETSIKSTISLKIAKVKKITVIFHIRMAQSAGKTVRQDLNEVPGNRFAGFPIEQIPASPLIKKRNNLFSHRRITL